MQPRTSPPASGLERDKLARAGVASSFALLSLLAMVRLCSPALFGADAPQWGAAWTRNQVSPEKGLPSSFDPRTGENVRWVAELGTQTHSTPVIAGGRVYIGTNNERPRDGKHEGDRGVLMCFDENDGSLLWQLVVPKRDEDPYFDWPFSGISSPATVEGDRVYIVSNRGEVLCLDAEGLADGNDGLFLDEGRHMTPASEPALEPGPLDADILWLFDLTRGAGIWSHDAAHSSILIRGDHLYLNSGTGVDNTHRRIRTPDAPSLVVLDKHTGRYLAREREGIAPSIFHSTWSPPSMGRAGDRDLVFFAAGNGVVYAFEPLGETPPPDRIATLEKVWEFDFDPDAPKKNVHEYNQNRGESPSNIYGMPVYHDGRLFVAGGGDLWWGKREARLRSIDVLAERDSDRGITDTGAVWSRDLERHVMSTPAVHDSLVYIADARRRIYAIDAEDGAVVWTHEAKGEFWASPYVADGKLWIGSRRGDFWILRAGREKEVLGTAEFGVPISATAVAANGALYIATMSHLYALRREVAGAESSALWGRAGEHWHPESRLPDFSYAGYRRGERPLPDREPELDVRGFGAAPDDEHDDTAAFRRAIEAADGKVLLVPAGRYVITGFLDLDSSGTVLRGEGPERSVLWFPTPLNDIEPNWGATTTGHRTSNYSWSGGFIRIGGSFSSEEIATVVAPARRGSTTLEVSSPERIRPGDEVRLILRDTPDQTLARHLYAEDPGPINNLGERTRESFFATIRAVDGRTVTLDRPLRTDVRLEWEPRIHSGRSSVEEVGIEELAFEFPETPYGGHFTELGFNAIAIGGTRNSWIRNVRIRNADSGIFVHGVNVTMDGVTIESTRAPELQRRATGHHGVTLGGQDNLLRNFLFETRFMHDITCTRGSAGNVAERGRGPDLCFDHHRHAPHSNLFTDLDLGAGTRMFQSGGGAELGRHSGAWTTFWNVRSERPQRWPEGWAPDLIQLVGVPGSDEPPERSLDGRWFEPIPPDKLEPENLREAQLERRLRRAGP